MCQRAAPHFFGRPIWRWQYVSCVRCRTPYSEHRRRSGCLNFDDEDDQLNRAHPDFLPGAATQKRLTHENPPNAPMLHGLAPDRRSRSRRDNPAEVPRFGRRRFQPSARAWQKMQRGAPLALTDVQVLAKSGVPDDTTLAYLRSTGASYQMSTGSDRPAPCRRGERPGCELSAARKPPARGDNTARLRAALWLRLSPKSGVSRFRSAFRGLWAITAAIEVAGTAEGAVEQLTRKLKGPHETTPSSSVRRRHTAFHGLHHHRQHYTVINSAPLQSGSFWSVPGLPAACWWQYGDAIPQLSRAPRRLRKYPQY